jgi:penicillin-binding protein 1A
MDLKNILETTKLRLAQALHYFRKHPFKAAGYGALVGLGMGLLFFMLIYFGAFGRLPNAAALAQLQNPLTSTLYGTDQKPIGFFYLQNRSNIDSTQLNPYLVDALVSTEDARFYEHSGIDYRSYARVFVKSILLQQDQAGGGSTITQQIAKNIFGRKEQPFLSTPINKVREMIIAKRMESVYTKDEILLLYFNTVSFGENLYGIEKAAQRFFAKKPKDLSLSESATLVGLLKAPTYFNPRNNLERAQGRRDVVLEQMVKYAKIDSTTAAGAKTALKLKYQKPLELSSTSTYFKNYVRKEFDLWAADNPADDGHVYDLEIDGLRIYTTLNPSVQIYAENAMQRNIIRLQNLMDDYWTSATTEGGKEGLLIKLSGRLASVKAMQDAGKTQEQIDAFLNEKKPRNYWKIGTGNTVKQQSLRDSIVNAITRIHTGLLVMDSNNGGIMGYLGGIDYGFSQIDNIAAKNQVGSTFKPISYLAGLENGIDACTFFDNSLRTYKEYADWKPRNANGQYGGSYSTHGALAKSINTVAVQLQLRTGTDNVIDMARKMGITSAIPKEPSIVLGTAELTLLEMVTAYCSIANGGLAVKPYSIARIENTKGEVLYEAKPGFHGRVASSYNVNQIQKMLEGVITSGSGSGFSGYGVPYNIIGKTGTTQNNNDGWFIGASPSVVIGSWVGTHDKRVQFNSTRMGAGANTAMPMVASVFKGMSSWRRPLLRNFSYNFTYFPCPAFSDSTATNAYNYYKADTMYVRNLLKRDSTVVAERKLKDSLLQDSLRLLMPQLESIEPSIIEELEKSGGL